MKIIAKIFTPYKEKFGIPRQAGIANSIVSKIVFQPEYRRKEALVGLSGYSHIWAIWRFSESEREEFSPSVRPPRLGGNKKVGVFATRSPFRPNPIGLSSLELVEIVETENEGTVLYVKGADMLDGTPIYDIKPYLPYTDSHPDAKAGFAEEVFDYKIEVDFPSNLLAKIDEKYRDSIIKILSEDPRPSYKKASEKEYGMLFADYEIFFIVKEQKLRVTRVLNKSIFAKNANFNY